MQIKKLLRYLPVTVMAAGIILASASPTLFSVNNSDNLNNLVFNTSQQNDDTNYSDQFEYIRNDVAKQTGVTDSIASIKLADSTSLGDGSAAIVTKTDGSTLLYMWGQNDYGQLGNSPGYTSTPTLVTALSGKNITQIALGEFHSAALLDDGSLYMWGLNEYGQLGNEKNSGKRAPNPIPAQVNSTHFESKKVIQISLGSVHSGALLEDGSVYMWGMNAGGQLGNTTNNGNDRPNHTPIKVTALIGEVTRIALGSAHSAALLDDGGLYMWGHNASGQLGFIANGYTPNPTPSKVIGLDSKKITKITLGESHSAALLEDGSLYTWGLNSWGQLGNGTSGSPANTSTPTKVDINSASPINQIALGALHSAALLDDGSLYMWGFNYYGQLGTMTNSGIFESNPTPAQVNPSLFNSRKVIKIVLGNGHSTALLEDGNSYIWGRNNYGQLSFTANTAPNPIPRMSSLVGDVSNITANSLITAKAAVENLWVDNKFYLTGFKNSFNLVNIPDFADQTFAIDAEPTYDNATGTVTVNIKIKYFYDEDGLIVANTAATPMIISGFTPGPNIVTDITAETVITNALVIDKWLTYVTVDGKISRTKLEEFLTLTDVPADAKFAIANLNQNNKTGALTFNITSSKTIDDQGEVLNTPSDPFLISLNLTPRITAMTPKASGYSSDLTIDELRAKLFNEDGLVIDLIELQKYLTIVAPVDNITYHLVEDTWNPKPIEGTVSFDIYASEYYDENAYKQTGNANNAGKVAVFVRLQRAASTIALKAEMPDIRVDNFETYVKSTGTTVANSRLREFFNLANISNSAKFSIANVDIDAFDANFTRNHLTFDLTIDQFNQGSPATPSTYTHNYGLTLGIQHQQTVIKAKSTYDQSIRVDKVANELNTLTGPALVAYLNNYLDTQSIPSNATINVGNITAVDATGKLTFNVIPSQIYNANSDLVSPSTNQFNISLELKPKEFTPTNIKTLPASVHPQDLTPTQFKQRLITDGATNTGETYALSAANITFLKKFLILGSIPADAKYTMTFVAQTYANTAQMNFSLTFDKYYNADGYYTDAPKTYDSLSLSLSATDLPIKPKTEITAKSDAEVVNTPNDFLNSIKNPDGLYNLEELGKYIDGLSTIPTDGAITIVQDGISADGTAHFILKVSKYYNGTDANHQLNGGFKFTVKTNQVAPTSTEDSTGLTVGLVIGGVVLVLLLVGLYIWNKKRIQAAGETPGGKDGKAKAEKSKQAKDLAGTEVKTNDSIKIAKTEGSLDQSNVANTAQVSDHAPIELGENKNSAEPTSGETKSDKAAKTSKTKSLSPNKTTNIDKPKSNPQATKKLNASDEHKPKSTNKTKSIDDVKAKDFNKKA